MKASDKTTAPEANSLAPDEITIADVARIAGVSVSTVSRILNDKPDVSEGTRRRVKQVIDEIGYSPHALAQRLAASRSRSIALIFPLNDGIDRGEVATFIVQTAFTAEKEHYLFSLLAAPTTESRLLNLYRSAQVEGVILMEIHMQDWRVELLKRHGYPFVMIGRCADNTGLTFIDFDYEVAAVMAVDHLVGLGHRKIAFLNSEALREEGYGPAVRFYQGFERARQQHDADLIHVKAETIADAVRALAQVDVTALIIGVYSFLIPELISAIIRHGYNIPGSLSVVCLQADDITKNLNPPMTSLSFDVQTTADHAAKVLIDRLEGRTTEIEQIVLPPRLMVRESTIQPRQPG